MKTKGFTLIELLIVVAIIGILAAIAIPNFLEAQTRAKIAKAVGDMRTIATAIHMYTTDNQVPPPGKTYSGDPSFYNAILAMRYNNPPRTSWFISCEFLTTPIAYITSFPNDPFFLKAHPLYNILSFEYVNLIGVVNDPNSGASQAIKDMLSPRKIRLNGPGSPAQTTSFILACAGPDQMYPAIQHITYDPNATAYFVFGTPTSYPSAAPYDPTNGTISEGTIYRLE